MQQNPPPGAIAQSLATMSRAERRRTLAELDAHIAKMPVQPVQIPVPDLMADRVLAVWQCKEYTAQLWKPDNPEITPNLLGRLSVNKNKLRPDGTYETGFTWDTLQRVKLECGMGDHSAVEVFPATRNLINVSNMRHLWVFKLGVTLPFEWRGA